MKKELNYSDAYTKLEKLVDELEEGDVPLEKLSIKVNEAKSLIAVCEAKLRSVEEDVDVAMSAAKRNASKKKSK